MSTSSVTYLAALCLCAALIVGPRSSADEAAQVRRTIFEHHDQSGVPGKEIVTGTADLPAGAVVGWHTHPGDEAGYVTRGQLVLKVKGLPDRPLKAGDYFFNPRGVEHSLVAAPGTDGGEAYSTWIVDKGRPLLEPVK